MLLTFYWNSKHPEPRTDVEKVLKLIRSLGKNVTTRLIDTSNMTDEERYQAYIESVMPAVYNRYNARKVFGTNRISGASFGKEQPALVLKDGKKWDVYPHLERKRLVTIEGCLEKL